MIHWLGAFAFGQLIELPIHWRALKHRPPAQRLVIGFGATALTHPFVWFVFPQLFDDFLPMAIAAETFAVVAEAAWLRLFGVKRALAWSLAANTASCVLGLLFSACLIPWLG